MVSMKLQVKTKGKWATIFTFDDDDGDVDDEIRDIVRRLREIGYTARNVMFRMVEGRTVTWSWTDSAGWVFLLAPEAIKNPNGSPSKAVEDQEWLG